MGSILLNKVPRHVQGLDGDDDPATDKQTFKFKPCIAEFMRTSYCPPDIVLLVTKIGIERANPPHEEREAYRLYLSDGEYTIQGVIKTETYRFILTGETIEGSYIMLDKYEVKKAPRPNGNGEVAYLAIGNFHTVGHCPDYPSFTEKDDTGSSFSTDGKSFSTDGKRKDVDELDDGDTTPTMKKRKLDVEESKAVVVPKEDEHHVDGVMKAQTADIEKTNLSEIIDPHVDANKENLSPKDATDHDDTAEDSSPSTNTSTGSQTVTATSCTEDSQSLSTSQGEADQDDSFPEGSLRFPMDFYIREVCAHYNRCHRYDFVERRCMSMSSAYTSSSDDTAATTEYPPIVDPLEPDMVLDPCGQMLVATQSLSQPALLAIEAGKPVKKIPRHLDLIYLSTIPTLRPRQNSVCDIVACIDWVSPSVGYAAGIGPKRDIRITDQSTDKRVLLSVFDDPTNFTPSIGTVVLFRNLKTHKWDGYSLNAYTQDCTGWDWFLPNPFWFKACGSGTRAQHLRTWWREVRFPEKMRQSNGGAEDILVTGCSAHEVCQGTAGRIDLEAIENRKAYERWCRQEDGDEDDDD